MDKFIGWILFLSTIAFIVLYRIFSKNPEAFTSKFSMVDVIKGKNISSEEIISALKSSGFKDVKYFPEEYRFLAKSKISMSSWGEFIEVKLFEVNSERRIQFKSICSFTFQIFAWGKNKRNAKRFFKALNEI